MNTKGKNSAVDFYFIKNEQWQKEITRLRSIILDCNLQEELKWGCPCYTSGGANIVLIHVFKEYCAVLFFKGALLKDDDQILIQQTKNVQAQRQVRFTSMQEVVKKESLLKQYIYQAIEVEKAGLKVELKKSSEFAVAEEFQKKLNSHPALKAAFKKLTPGRQRAYLLYFSAPKQPKTREGRVEKSIPLILAGKGLNDL